MSLILEALVYYTVVTPDLDSLTMVANMRVGRAVLVV